jgi:hypothetical protein
MGGRAAGAGGGRSGEGIHGALWETGWGGWERYWKPRCQQREGAVPGTMPLAQAVPSGAAGTEEGFPRRRTTGKRLVAQELVLRFVP